MADCYWVEHDEFGNPKTCEWGDAQNKPGFEEGFCKLCIEGQKIEAMNNFRSMLHSIGDELPGDELGETKVITKILEKMMG